VARYEILHEIHRHCAVECLTGGDVLEASNHYRSATRAATMLPTLAGTLLANKSSGWQLALTACETNFGNCPLGSV
jgi:hypothetical protein